jgi:hypothetical protein
VVRCEIELGDGPLDVKVVIRTRPEWRVGADGGLALFERFFADVAALLEAVPEEDQLPNLVGRKTRKRMP